MIRIVTDSAADLTAAELSLPGIFVVPLSVTFADGTTQLDDGTMTKDEFFVRLAEDSKLPRTSQPSPASFMQVYEDAAAAGDEVLVITIGQKLSGTYQCAHLAAADVGLQAHIVDSEAASQAEALLVREAVRLRDEEGLTAEEIAAVLEQFKKRVRIVAVVDSLKHLQKGGRLPAAVALVGGAAACMLCFYQPFIAAVWLGPEYLLDERLMMLIVLYFFSWMFRIMQLTYRDAAGLWTEDWLKPYVGMAVNLVGSIWMVKATGSIAGVLVPTILVFFFIYTPWEAWVVVKYQFYRSWNEYMGKLLGYVLLAFAACAACYGACRWLSPDNTILSLLLRCVIVGVIYPGIWLGVTGRTAEWKQLWGILLRFLPKGKKAA